MPAGPHLRSIREIRMSLDEIPGAIRYQDPATETAGSGSDPAIELWLSQPDRVRYQSNAPTLDIDAESSDDSENGLVDEPAVIFEVPPEATLADVRNHLGKKRLGNRAVSPGSRNGCVRVVHNIPPESRSARRSHPVRGHLAFVVHALSEIDLPLGRKIQLAFHAILRHELFHFNVDCMTANWELATGSAAYWKGQDRYREPRQYVQLEEALANAYMLRGLKNPTRLLSNSGGKYQALKRFCARQPEGYGDAARCVKDPQPLP